MEKLLTNLKTYFYPNVIKIVVADHFLKILITLSFWRHFGKIEVRFYRIKQNNFSSLYRLPFIQLMLAKNKYLFPVQNMVSKYVQ